MVLLFCMVISGRSVLAETTPPTEQERQQIERNFLTSMIDHHEGAIQMAHLVQQRATHAELKALATKIINTQTQQQ
jgi:uncharacterized protein (DUF305 family)